MLSALLRLSAVLSIAVVAGCATSERQAMADVVMEEFRVTSDPGVEIYVRNKHPAGMNRFSGNKTVLFVHGATYPSESAFDLRLAGTSWMEYIARQGYDVYLLDVRGYGMSTRPPQMDKRPEENPPFAGTTEAIRDVDAVVDFIRKRRGIERLNLLGWSWGTAVFQNLHQPPKPEGGKAGSLCAGMDSPDGFTCAGGNRPPSRLSIRHHGPSQGALADRRGRRQEGRPHPARLVRGVGRGHARKRSGRGQADATCRARAQRSRRRWDTQSRQGRDGLESGRYSSACAADQSRMGPRYAGIHGADPVSQAGQRSLQALRRVGRRNALHHDGEEIE